MCSRGAFIVFEGLDSVGKSKYIDFLVKDLADTPLHVMAFPERRPTTTDVGEYVNKYLFKEIETCSRGVQLAFTSERFHFKADMRNKLMSGKTLIVDMYSYTGIACGVARGLDFQWCRMLETDLLRPDVVFQLITPPEMLVQRIDADERWFFEAAGHKKLADTFEEIKLMVGNDWKTINTAGKLNETDIRLQILEMTKDVLQAVKNQPLKTISF